MAPSGGLFCDAFLITPNAECFTVLNDVRKEAVTKQWCVVLCVDSSISGGLNSLAAVTLQDVVRHFWFPDMHEHRATFVSKCIGESRLGYPRSVRQKHL